MTASPRLVVTQADYDVAYLVSMHALLFTNLFLAGRFLSSLVLVPLARVGLVLAARFFGRLLAQARPSLSALDLAVSIYFVYSVASLVLFTTPANPASPRAYLYGLNIQVLPMLMYFAVKGLGEYDLRRIVRVFIGLQAICAMVGIVLFLARPNFYTAYLGERLGVEQEWQSYARLQSYIGSTATGILSAVAIALLADVRWSRFVRYALAVLFLLTIFLTQQRGAYVSGILAAGFFLYRSRVSPLALAAAVGVSVAALLVTLGSLGFGTDLLADLFRSRVVEDLIQGSPVGERAEAYEKGLGFISTFPLGLGLGATTSAADDAGAHVGGQVVDAYYMRVASDLGVPGLALFIAVLAVGAYVAARSPRYRAFAVVVLIYAFQSTGTNVLDSYFVSHVFWMWLGFAGSIPGPGPIPQQGLRFVRRDAATSQGLPVPAAEFRQGGPC
jgi:hypothetical protein